MRVLRVSSFTGFGGVGHVEFVVICDDGEKRAIRISFDQAAQMAEAAEKMESTARDMARHAHD